MNAIVETINSAGRTFVEFALPMLIQSSVLILILLAVDILLRRRVRAVFRYWIWMLVLVKLVLPPSLGSPVSIGAWLGETLEPPQIAVDEPLAPQPQMPPAESQPQAKLGDGTPVVVDHIREVQTSAPSVAAASDSLPMEALRVPTPEGAQSAPETPSPAASTLGWPAVVLLVWLAIVSALLLLLLQRAWFVRGLVAQAQEAPPSLKTALDQFRSRMDVGRPISLRISPNASSPAVCGLLRPVILIPQSLAPRLQPHDLQAVLLHELAHVRRGDLWVNLIQTLLQIAYFYNPLLWLANAMIRRTREQAVDEAVLVAMGETAPDYPETLLHVAKLAFHRRPALSLRLIGVVESTSALRSRIKHILTRPLPKTARLGLLGLVAVFLIAAVLLPMAKARPLTDRARSVMSLADEEARRLNHAYVGTEHILLALARQEDAVSAKVLANLGADIDTLRTEVNKFVQLGARATRLGRASPLPRMPRVERAMQYAKEEARTLGHDYIGTEHILLALLRDKDSVAAQVLAELGITQTQIRTQVLTFVQPGRQDPEEDNDEGAGGGALVEPPEAQSSGVVAELPNGVTVEFLAYSQLTLEELRWWTLDGESTTIPGLYQADVEGHGVLLALRIEPEPEYALAWSYQPPDIHHTLKFWRMEGSNIWLAALGQQRNYVNVEIYARLKDPPAVQFVSIQEKDADGEIRIGAHGSQKIIGLSAVDSNTAQFMVTSMEDGPRAVAAQDTSGRLHRIRLLREVALPQDPRASKGQRYQVDMSLSDLAGIVIEGVAARGGGVKFRNIPLTGKQPGQLRVEIAPGDEKPMWYASGLSSELKKLGIALSDHAASHEGRYPEHLSELGDALGKSGREFVEQHVTYLGMDKTPSVPADTPLAYVTTLLPFGFGTYVLYSDGRVEFEGPVELAELGIPVVGAKPSAPLAWQRTDRYVPPDPNSFFPDDPQGGKQLDALFQAADKDERPDEEIFSTVRQGLRRTTQHRTLILQWIGNRYVWGKDPQNPRAVEILYHAVPLERHYAVYFGLSVVRNKTPNILRTLADICMEGQEVGRTTWGLGDQREMLLAYISPHLQDTDPARRQIAEMLVKHFKGELDFEQWQREKYLEEAKAKFSGELPQFRETLLTGGSGARYEVLSTIQRNRLAEILEDSFVPALRAAGGDPDPKVRNEVARIAGYRWVWSAQQQDPNVIELMLKLSSDSNREVRSNAVYYGLSVVRDKSESVIRRLVSLALADQEQNFYGRIVWGLKGSMRADRQLVERVLTRELEDAGTDAKRAAVHRLFKDVLGEDAPPHRELSGRVLDPNGAPVAGAQVAWIDADRSVSITDGRLMEPRFGDRGKGPIVETDERGYFRFEEEPNDGFSLVAAHEAGFALVSSEQFATDRMIRLEPLGRVEGRVAQGRKPAGDKIWMGGLPNSTWFKHRRDYRYETLCDSEGRFTFKRVPPGWFEVGYLIDNGDSSASLTSRTPVVVAPGQTATVTLGGEGRPVIGRFVPPPDWEGPIYFGAGLRALDTVHPERPRPDDYSRMTQRQQQEWIKQWHQTPEAEEYLKAVWHNPNRRHYTFCIADDGTFRIKDVIPGKYSLTVWLEERLSGERPEEFGGYSGTIEVPPMDEAYSDDPLDVGDLVLRLRRPLHVGDLAPLFEAQTIDGKAIRLADYRGRFVLLSFWHPASHPELDRLKELHATYGAAGKLQIIGLGGSDTLDEVKKFVAEQAVLWPQIYFGQAWDQGIAKQYGLSGLPYILLIDPDGKIIATWLRGEKLSSTVREALAAFTQD